jgi:acetyl esterase/lipase
MSGTLAERLADSAVANIIARDCRVLKGVEYARPAGTPLRATLYLPEAERHTPRPGVVQIHGGGWVMGTRFQQMWYCHRLARNGYAVMAIDYRMLPRFGFPECLEDCKSAVRWMRLNATRYRINPDRIATFGASAGGHLAGLLATTREKDGFEGHENPGPSSAVQAAISLYGAVDLTKYRDIPRGTRFGKCTKPFFRRFAGDACATGYMDYFEVASPTSYASRNTCPIMFVHGEDDTIVHFAQSQALHARLQELGVPTELTPVPHRGHAFDYFHVIERERVFTKMLSFLKRHL